MKISFRHRLSNALLCEIEIGDDVAPEFRVKMALERAVGGGANLRNADLRDANLRGAGLRDANLRGANLRGADLRDANLRGANLRNADLRGANLRDANLRGADLRGADLRDANLRDADLRNADLRGADLRDADLRDADLRNADLRGAKLPSFAHCPEEGAFVAWKNLANNAVAKLEIPAEAKRVCSLVGRKMRAEYVKTLAIFVRDGEPLTSGVGSHDGTTKYIVGEITRPDKFDDDIRVECTHGIHFFITRKEAEEY